MRYRIQHGGSPATGGTMGYLVWDDQAKRIVYESDHKPHCIARAQKLNRLAPIDGSEQTYAQQVRDNTDRWGRDIRKETPQ